MTAPGAGQSINLAALWIPVMPDTAHMGEEMRKAGGEAKSQFEQGFNSSGSSPENIGQSFGSKLISSINKEMKGIELPLGTSSVFEKLNGEVDKSVEKLRGKASEALQKYREEYDNLGAAQARASEAEQKVNAARDGGFNKASIMIPLLQEQTAAQNALKEAHTSTSAALDDYNGHLGKLSAAHKEASGSGSLMAGVMGGAVVAGVTLAVSAVDKLAESIIEGAIEAFKTGVEGAKEFADKMIELGESYEHIGIQITEFSNLSGEAFESTEKAAQQVFSGLDVAGADTGKTMVQLASSLNAPGEEIKSLVTHVEELQGRFTDLKSTDLAHIFYDFQVPAEDADKALASLLESARGSGQDLGQLTQALSGIAGLTLKEAGLNLEQSGAFMADLLKYGEPGRQVMTGLSAAMKEFGKEGLSFEDGMKLAGQRLKDLGDTAEGQDLAEKLFGTRNWIVAKDAVQEYMNVVAQGPDAFNANASSLDEFVEKTRTLENEWELVKHKAEEAFLPMGLEAVHLAGEGLDALVEFVKTHMDEIKAAVKGGGDFIIKFASQTEQLAIGVLEFFSPIVGAIERMMSGALISLGDFANVTGQILSYVPGMHDIGQGMADAGKAADGFGHDLAKVDVGKGMGDLAEWLKKHPIDVEGATKSWDEFADHVGTSMDSANEAVSKAGSWFAPSPGGIGAPQVGTGRLTNSASAAPGVGHVADWDAIAAKEGGGQWNSTYTTGVHEGGGLQIKPETWSDYGGLEFAPAPYQATKEQQEEVANRILNGWNGKPGQGPNAWANGQTYVEAQPNSTPSAPVGPPPSSVAPSGIDSQILANTPPGVYVDPGGTFDLSKGLADCSSAIGDLVKQIQGQAPGGSNRLATGNAPEWLAQHGFLPNNTGANIPGAFNIGDNNHHMQATLPGGTNFNWGSNEAAAKGGVAGGGAFDPTQGFTSHWYLPMDGSGVVAGAPGSTPGGKNGAAYPGLPGQFGGLGVYGGETADQAFSTAQAVQEAQDRQSDLDYQVSQHQQKVNDIRAELTQGDPNANKKGLLGGNLTESPEQQKAWADKQKSLNEQLASATHDLTVSLREQGEQGGKITEAQRKQQEAMYKKPTGTQAGGNKDAQSLGSGLLSGISEELGLGTVFGKSPLDWGIVKLAEGLFNYANNLGDAIFGQTGMGGPGGSGGLSSGASGLGGGLANGLLGSLGIKTPNAMLSSGPNVVPGAPPGTPIGAAGTGQGPLPGPVINQDNSINVQAGVDPGQIMAPVQELQNSSNSAAYQFQGSLPAQ